MCHEARGISIPVIIFTLGVVTLVSALEDSSSSQDDKSTNIDSDLDFDKRLYNFGLGKRAYSYVSEYKRLPVYNFGLGKRSPRYDFGLGKRSETEEDEENLDDYEDYQYNDDEDSKIPETELYLDDDMQALDKRQKMYSFGLGKRIPRYEFGLGKRAGRYEFGLGKRAQRFSFGLGKRERLYNFGLGKRNRLYSFGLGKRPSQAQSRFNFGLGKRDPYQSIDKREIAPAELEQINDENNSAETDFAHASATSEHSDKLNDTIEMDSHEVMGHSDKNHSHLAKRSAYRYDFGLGKRGYRYPQGSGFSRQFRKPLYNFGLGKRRPMYDFGLGKRSY